jgi:hypothetical protein
LRQRRKVPAAFHFLAIAICPALPAKKTGGMKLTIRPGGLAKAGALFDKINHACNMAAPIWGAA